MKQEKNDDSESVWGIGHEKPNSWSREVSRKVDQQGAQKKSQWTRRSSIVTNEEMEGNQRYEG